MSHRPQFLLGLLVGLAVLAGGGLAAVKASGDGAGSIHACIRKGAVRIVSATAACKKGERALTWNVQGPRGDAGVPGAAGQQGPAGAAGPAGPAGAKGSTGAAGPAGPAGARGAAGTVGATGPAGPQGIAGLEGPRGLQGLQGAQGPKGDPGSSMSSLEDLGGVPCHAGAQAGTIAVTYDGSARAILTCSTGGGGGGETTGVRVNEFSTGVTGALTDEFVELYNGGTTPAAIGGFKVVYRSATGSSDTTLVTIPAGTTLAAGAFYLLGGASYSGTHAADQSFSAGLASTGGSVAFKDAAGTVIDAVAYGTAANGLGEGSPATAPPTTASPGSSDVRLPDGHDTDANSVDFDVTTTPTPGVANHS